MTTATDRWVDAGPGFDRVAAELVYKTMTSMDPDSALVFGRVLVGDAIHWDLIAHRDEIAKTVEQQCERRATALRRHYAREAVAKTRRGQDADHELACLVAIGKAWPFSTEERRRYAAARHRDELGRFVEDHQQIHTEPRAPMDHQLAAQMGIPAPANKLEGATLAHYQQAYAQIHDMLAPYRNTNLNPLLHLRVSHNDGTTTTHVVGVNAKGEPAKIAGHLREGSRIRGAAVSVTPEPGRVSTAMFDALSAAGAPRLGGYAMDAFREKGALSATGLQRFNEQRTKIDPNEPYSPTTAAFGRLQRGAKLIDNSLGEHVPAPVRNALAVANHIGQYGPEAQKILGPTADRLAYRYRGTERAPSRQLLGALQVINNTRLSQRDKRDIIVGGRETDEGWDPGPVLRYFRRHLPNPDLNELQRKSGVIPPSEGAIIDRGNNVITQASGFADDWYLPFNLRHLAALKGGEYIRTRSFGGPTTEDVYTGLMSGARSLTVVSHTGVYTINFDRTLRGGRRFNDKATRMVARYGHLLDALRSNQVGRGDISSSRLEELIAAKVAPMGLRPGSKEYAEEVRRVKADERRHPEMSQRERQAAAIAWLDQAAARRRTADGGPQSIDDMERDLMVEAARKQKTADQARYGVSRPLEQYTADAKNMVVPDDQVATARNVATALGGTAPEAFERHMARAERENRDRVQQMSLNGAGYFDALQALKEQFPYFIDTVQYHEWRDSVGNADENTHEGRRDTGYVLPRHNRPADAESGYFDSRVTGQGKVRADTTRYQNFRVNQGKPEPVGEEAKKAKEAKDAERKEGGGGSDEDKQRKADLALLDALVAAKTIAAGTTVRDVKQVHELGGEDIRGVVNDKSFDQIARGDDGLKALQDLYRPGGDREFRSALRDPEKAPEYRKKLQQILDSEWVKVDSGLTHAFKNKGEKEPAKELTGDVRAMLGERGRDHTFPGEPGLDPNTRMDPAGIHAAFRGDKGIGRLNLPDLGDPGFGSAADDVADTIREAYDSDRDRVADGGQPDRQIGYDAKALLRAQQYHRNYHAALRRQKAEPAPPQGAGPNVQNQVGFITAADMQNWLDNVAEAPAAPGPTVVEPDPDPTRQALNTAWKT